MNLAELYNDRQKYPDETTIELGGEKMSLKEWRDSLGLKSEFTRHTQELSAKQKQAEQIMREQAQQLQASQVQLAQAMQARGVQAPVQDDLSAYRSDPAFGPLVKLIETQQQTLGHLAQRMQMDEISANSFRYQTQLERLKEKDADLDTQGLARFAHDLYSKGPDMHAAYKLYTEDSRMKKAIEEAERRGYEKAKTEPPIPPQPGNGRGGSRQAVELPKDPNQRLQMAAQEFGADLAEALAQGQ